MAAECTPVDTSPAGTLRAAAYRLQQEIAAVHLDLRDNPYWGGEQRPADAYARGVAGGLGGPAGDYAATMHPWVGLGLATAFHVAADDFETRVLPPPASSALLVVARAVLGAQR